MDNGAFRGAMCCGMPRSFAKAKFKAGCQRFEGKHSEVTRRHSMRSVEPLMST